MQNNEKLIILKKQVFLKIINEEKYLFSNNRTI